MFTKKYPEGLVICVAFLAVGQSSSAQVDSAGKNLSSAIFYAQTGARSMTTPLLPHGNYLAFGRDPIHTQKSACPFRHSDNAPGRSAASIVLHVAGIAFLTYAGEKTHHPYRPGQGN